MVEYIPFSDDADSEFDLLSETQQLFGPDTPLKDAENVGGRPYEERPQQISMAQKIAEAMQEGKHLCVEAPTGVGKSIAYLIPAILRARHTGKAVVVSTHTIALQEQLIEKDIPMLQRCLGIPFSATLAKGRANYVCLHRLKNCHHQHQDFLPDERLLPEVARIANWAEESKDGSLTDLPFKPDSQTWSSVCSEAGVCSREQNYPDQHCFFAKARRRLYTVDIIVTNHALLCSDIAMREESDGLQSILPDYGALVIDEAHTFEQVAATHLGIRVNTFGVFLLLSRLYNTRSRRGLLHRAEAMEARQACIAATETTTRFFKQLESWLADQHENPLAFKDAGHIPNKLKEPWQQLSKEIQTLAKTTVDDDYRRELNSVNDRLIETGRNLDIFFSRQLEDYVYWFERFGRDLRYISFNAVPIEVNNILRNVLFNKEFPVIMTSATMAVNNKLSYFKERLGCDEAMDVILDSPFNFAEQVDLYVPAKEMPDPRDQDSYIEACCQQIKHFLEMSQGRAFVLFTSYRQICLPIISLNRTTACWYRAKICSAIKCWKSSAKIPTPYFSEPIVSGWASMSPEKL